MKINCISCGHQFEVDDETYARYHGALRCWVCHAVMVVQIVDGCVESVLLPGMVAAGMTDGAPRARPIGAAKAKLVAKEASHE